MFTASDRRGYGIIAIFTLVVFPNVRLVFCYACILLKCHPKKLLKRMLDKRPAFVVSLNW
uniref:Uncharacterized protein n=1 Tax=Romanomermis culicivorax TaxID=13658 RepID=A0A915K9A3_ROMCU